MMKTVLILSSILALTLSEVIYGGQPRGSIISLPYPYQDSQEDTLVYSPPYHSHPEVIVEVPSTTVVTPAGLISTAVNNTLGSAKAVLSLILTKAPALIAGSVIALGICKFTCLCDSQVTIYEAQSELSSFATPERLTRAAKFVTEAVRKYNNMQNNN